MRHRAFDLDIIDNYMNPVYSASMSWNVGLGEKNLPIIMVSSSFCFSYVFYFLLKSDLFIWV